MRSDNACSSPGDEHTPTEYPYPNNPKTGMFSPMHPFKNYTFLFLSLVPVLACQAPDSPDTALPPPDNGMEAIFTDTVTVRASTVLLDSVATSGAALLLAGRYHDNRLGSVVAGSVVAFGYEAQPTVDESLIYDSLVLSLDYAYSYGDTNQVQHLHIHSLEEELSADKTYYNSDRVAYRSTPLGSKTFKPRPNTRIPLRIRLEDALGHALFNEMKDGGFTEETFKSVLKGIVVLPGENDNGAILGFRTISDSTVIRLHCHTNDLDLKPETFTFKAPESSVRFNQLQSDRSSTLLAPLQRTRQALDASLTGEETFLLAGIGLVTRLEFPYLRNFANLYPLGINRAELVVQPVGNSHNRQYPLPTKLELFEVDGANRSRAAEALTQAFLTEDLVNQDKFYRAALTDYIIESIREGPVHRNGLLISFGSATFRQSAEKLVLGGAAHATDPVKLRVYYTRFNP